MSKQITTSEDREELRCKAELKAYNDTLRRIAGLEKRIADFRETIDNPTTSIWSDMPRTQNTTGISRQERALIRLEEMQEKLAALVEREAKQYKRIMAALDKLEAEDELLLSLRYIDQMKWDKISEELFGYEEDFFDNPEKYQKRTFRIHGKALKNLEEVYDEIYPLTEKSAPAPEE